MTLPAMSSISLMFDCVLSMCSVFSHLVSFLWVSYAFFHQLFLLTKLFASTTEIQNMLKLFPTGQAS